MPAPFVYDAADEPQGEVWHDPVAQRLTRVYGQTSVTVSVDGAWLHDPARRYPVVIDPTIRIQPVPTDAQDVQIYSGATGTNYNNTYQLKVGTDTSAAYRSLVRFPLAGVPAGTTLDDARLELYYDQTHYAWGFDVAMEARRVTQPWSESPTAATLVAPVSPTVRTYQDTSGRPTPADTPDTELGQLYYYMVAVKTADGQVIPGVTLSARLPKAGQIKQIVRTGTVDTTLSAARPTENVDVYDGDRTSHPATTPASTATPGGWSSSPR